MQAVQHQETPTTQNKHPNRCKRSWVLLFVGLFGVLEVFGTLGGVLRSSSRKPERAKHATQQIVMFFWLLRFGVCKEVHFCLR